MNELKVKESDRNYTLPCLKELEARGSPYSKLKEYLLEGVKRFNEAREKLKPYQDLLRSFLENPKVRGKDKEKSSSLNEYRSEKKENTCIGLLSH